MTYHSLQNGKICSDIVQSAAHALLDPVILSHICPHLAHIVKTHEPQLAGQEIISYISHPRPQLQVVECNMIPCEPVLAEAPEVALATQELRLIEGCMCNGSPAANPIGKDPRFACEHRIYDELHVGQCEGHRGLRIAGWGSGIRWHIPSPAGAEGAVWRVLLKV